MPRKNNWYMTAKMSGDAEIKQLLTDYETVDMNDPDAQDKKDSIKQQIRIKLGMDAPIVADPEPVAEPETEPEHDELDDIPDAVDELETEPETKPEPDAEPEKTVQPEPVSVDDAQPAAEKTTAFNRTEQEAAKAKDYKTIDEIRKDCRAEIVRLEKTRLKHATYKQNLELDNKIWAVRRIISIATRRELALRERENRLKKIARTSNVMIKRARFVKLWRQGISITNITKAQEGVRKEDLLDVLDDATIEACRKHNSKFPEMWEKWKAKFMPESKKTD